MPAKCAVVLPHWRGHIKVKHALSLACAYASPGPRDSKGYWVGVETVRLGRTRRGWGVEGSGREEGEQAAENPREGEARRQDHL